MRHSQRSGERMSEKIAALLHAGSKPGGRLGASSKSSETGSRVSLAEKGNGAIVDIVLETPHSTLSPHILQFCQYKSQEYENEVA